MNDEVSVDFSDAEQCIWLRLSDEGGSDGIWMSASRAAFIAGLLTAAVEAIRVNGD